MKPRAPYQYPPEQDAQMRHAVRLQLVGIFLMATVVGLMATTMGSSQAMKTAWIEDTLSFVPPIAFLIAARARRKAPSEAWPYGHHRAMSVAFLVAATTLASFGLMLLFDALSALLQREHPTIGVVSLFGHEVWEGWLMIGVLGYSVLPPFVLGRLKLPVARALHAKVLLADANMNKADWTTGAAAALGIVGIGFGLWWADAVAALVISWSVLSDGVRALKTAIADLMDHAARAVDDEEPFDVPEQLNRLFASLPWVREHAIRLREEGDVCAGEVFVVPHSDQLLSAHIAEAERTARALDWRIYDLTIMPVASLRGASRDSVPPSQQ